jgi:hypothetical protein
MPLFVQKDRHFWLSSQKRLMVLSLKSYFPRLYTSRALALYLFKNKMTILGTCKLNRRGIPPEMKEVKGRPEGDYTAVYEQGGKMSLHSFLDKSKKGTLLFNFTSESNLLKKQPNSSCTYIYCSSSSIADPELAVD